MAVSQLQIDADGNVFVANRISSEAAGVYMLNPSAPQENFTPVLSGKTNYLKISAFSIVGTGEDQVLYAINDLDGVRKYNIGDGVRPNTQEVEEYMYNTWGNRIRNLRQKGC